MHISYIHRIFLTHIEYMYNPCIIREWNWWRRCWCIFLLLVYLPFIFIIHAGSLLLHLCGQEAKTHHFAHLLAGAVSVHHSMPRMYIFMHVCTYLCMCACACACVCVCVCVCVSFWTSITSFVSRIHLAVARYYYIITW